MNAAGLSSSPNPRASFASSAGFPARAAAPAASSARVRGAPGQLLGDGGEHRLGLRVRDAEVRAARRAPRSAAAGAPARRCRGRARRREQVQRPAHRPGLDQPAALPERILHPAPLQAVDARPQGQLGRRRHLRVQPAEVRDDGERPAAWTRARRGAGGASARRAPIPRSAAPSGAAYRPRPDPQGACGLAEQPLDEHAVAPLAVELPVAALDPDLVEACRAVDGAARRVRGEDPRGELVVAGVGRRRAEALEQRPAGAARRARRARRRRRAPPPRRTRSGRSTRSRARSRAASRRPRRRGTGRGSPSHAATSSGVRGRVSNVASRSSIPSL